MARNPEPYGAVGRSEWMDVDWQQHLRWVRVQDRWMNIVEFGEGPDLIFIHGLSGCWQNWLEQLPHFARDHRVIAVDLPGFGQSEMPAEEISISGYADTIDALMTELGVDSARIVGNSMGGFIAAEMAFSYPERVERLVLAAAAGISITNLYRRPMLTAARAGTAVGYFRMTRRREVVVRPRLRHIALAAVVRHPALIHPGLVHEFTRGVEAPGPVPALDALMTYDIRDRLEEITCPTLLVWGEKDLLVPVADAEEFERRIPDARKVSLEDTGHLPQIERAGRFNRELLSFLHQPSAGPGEKGAGLGRGSSSSRGAPERPRAHAADG